MSASILYWNEWRAERLTVQEFLEIYRVRGGSNQSRAPQQINTCRAASTNGCSLASASEAGNPWGSSASQSACRSHPAAVRLQSSDESSDFDASCGGMGGISTAQAHQKATSRRQKVASTLFTRPHRPQHGGKNRRQTRRDEGKRQEKRGRRLRSEQALGRPVPAELKSRFSREKQGRVRLGCRCVMGLGNIGRPAMWSIRHVLPRFNR